MRNDKTLIYLAIGIYTVMINWYYNESIICAILTWIFWPAYLIYSILSGHLAHGAWLSIPQSFFL